MWTKAFWKSVAERSISTFLQAFIGAVAVGVGFQDVNWVAVFSVAGVAFLVSVAKNILVALGSDGNPSVGSVEAVVPEGDAL